MKPGDIFINYAECWRGCDDPDCPYTHIETWTVVGVGVFPTEHSAKLAADAMLAARGEG